MPVVKDVEELGIKLSDDEKEILHLDEMLSFEQDENIQLHSRVLILENELKVVKEERDELKESLMELDPTYGDVVLQSDRAYEMRYD